MPVETDPRLLNDELWTLLREAHRKIEDRPQILWEKKLDQPTVLNVSHINRLAIEAGLSSFKVFDQTEHTRNGQVEARRLEVFQPMVGDPVEVILWHRVLPERPSESRIRRILDHLADWLELRAKQLRGELPVEYFDWLTLKVFGEGAAYPRSENPAHRETVRTLAARLRAAATERGCPADSDNRSCAQWIRDWLASEHGYNDSQAGHTPVSRALKLLEHSVQEPAAKTPAPRRPSEDALKAWRLRDLTGLKTQLDIAEKMSAELGRPVTQGQVSRWLKQVDVYRQAGNIFPDLPGLSGPPQSIDPAVLDLGKRADGHAPRQRRRRRDG